MSSSNRYNTRPLAALSVAASTFTITTPSVVRRRHRAHDTPRTQSLFHSFMHSFIHALSCTHSCARVTRAPSAVHRHHPSSPVSDAPACSASTTAANARDAAVDISRVHVSRRRPKSSPNQSRNRSNQSRARASRRRSRGETRLSRRVAVARDRS